MNFELLQINDQINVKYTLQHCVDESDILIVSFPGGGGRFYDELGYIFTLKKFNCHGLFFKAESDVVKSMFCFYKKTTIVEDKIWKFIDEKAKELGCSRIIFIGSSLGGFCALYYGLKHNCDIISGSPMLCTEKNSYIEFCAGEGGDSNVEWVNSQLKAVIKSNNRVFNKNIFLSFGNGEPNWLIKDGGKDLCEMLESMGIHHRLKLFPFKNHHSIHRLFPLVIDAVLPHYINSTVSDMNLDFLGNNSDISAIGFLQNLINELLKLLKSQSLDSFDFDNMRATGLSVFQSKDDSEELLDFCYVNSGYFFDRRGKSVINFEEKGGFWSIDSEKINEYFGFQSCLLHLYYRTNDIKILKWLDENICDYFSLDRKVKKVKKSRFRPSLLLNRFFFFFSILSLPDFKSCSMYSFRGNILKILKHDMLLMLRKPIFNIHILPYHVIRAAFHYSLIIRQYEHTFKTAVSKIFNLLDYLNKLNFNSDGICTLDLSLHEKISVELHSCIDFLDANNFNEFHELKKFKGFIKKIDLVNSHILKPDNRLASIGHAASIVSRLSEYVKRKSTNYIKPSFDLAILEDEHSYICVGSGNPYRSKYRHSDLMSFSWNYDSVDLFRNAGCATKDKLFVYSCSKFAHNSFFSQDTDYVVPSYMDFTTIESFIEKDDYVVLSMKHELVSDTVFSRKIVWIKPNIIVLIDKADSTIEHKYIQNFLLENYKYKVLNNSEVLINFADKSFVRVRNHPQPNCCPKLVISDKKLLNSQMYLGKLIHENKKSLKQGLNFSFCSNSVNCLLITSIEIVKSKDGKSSFNDLSFNEDCLKLNFFDKTKSILLHGVLD